MDTLASSTISKRPRLASATYSLAEVAALWHISYTTAHIGAQAGTLPVTPFRIGRRYRFPKATVDRLLEIGDAEPLDAA